MSIHASRLTTLRDLLSAEGFDGLFVPNSDAFGSEFLHESEKRVHFLSGFTGTDGMLIILKDRAVFMTDSRYTLQAKYEMSSALFSIEDAAVKSPLAWLKENGTKGMKIAYDPRLHNDHLRERLDGALREIGAELVAISENPVDKIWNDRPAPPNDPVYALDFAYTGRKVCDKLLDVAEYLKKHNLSAAILADPASVAWLLNIRGNDTPNTPLALSTAIIDADGVVKWFIDPAKIPPSLSRHLGKDVDILPPDALGEALDSFAVNKLPVRVNSRHANSWVMNRLRHANVRLDIGGDPTELMQAKRNATEIDGARAAHRRDGAALSSFFAWIDRCWQSEKVTEITAVQKLAEFRQKNNLYHGPSFPWIAGIGANGAIVHYDYPQDIALEAGQLFLVDSGGQYLDGTTDVTRTVVIGSPSAEMRDRFTRVLKGHIALASVRFPRGTRGVDLDVLARQYLWQAGIDYGHGTGHGVGAYLGVHDGPQGISHRNMVELEPGMVLSNEPGYYKAGAYGIRIENLQIVIEAPTIAGAEKPMLAFEPLTLVPIDLRLIDFHLLTVPEIEWLNAYHQRVYDTINPMVDAETGLWLKNATTPIALPKAPQNWIVNI